MTQLARPKHVFPLVRHLSYHTTPYLARAYVTPNLVTTMSLVLGLVAAWSFSFGNAEGDFTGALLLLGCYVLDNCDGELARLTDSSTSFGQLLDTTVDWLVHAALFIGLGIGADRLIQGAILVHGLARLTGEVALRQQPENIARRLVKA